MYTEEKGLGPETISKEVGGLMFSIDIEGMDEMQIKHFALFLYDEDQNKRK